MSEKVTAGPWLYRPLEHDDWGYIRDEANDNRIIAVAKYDNFLSSAEVERHRVAKTDPSERTGNLICAAVNACFAINPEHPEKVAAEIGEAFSILNAFITTGDKIIACDKTADDDLTDLDERARELLARLTDKETK